MRILCHEWVEQPFRRTGKISSLKSSLPVCQPISSAWRNPQKPPHFCAFLAEKELVPGRPMSKAIAIATLLSHSLPENIIMVLFFYSADVSFLAIKGWSMVFAVTCLLWQNWKRVFGVFRQSICVTFPYKPELRKWKSEHCGVTSCESVVTIRHFQRAVYVTGLRGLFCNEANGPFGKAKNKIEGNKLWSRPLSFRHLS